MKRSHLVNLVTSLNQTSYYQGCDQSGFRAKHSCETTINDVLYDWIAAQNDSKVIAMATIDFSRAFKTINQLIHKLAGFGVQETSLKWFASYLQNRTQTVKIGKKVSEELRNNLGVPNGSILGPLLFILYINCIGKCLKYYKIKFFADDTMIYVIADSIEHAIKMLNEDLKILFDVLCQHKLKINIDKTKAMVITNKKINRENINIYIIHKQHKDKN